ncbi:VWA domain-containing protein [Conexibacter sp. CPCC 206217]|uniref:vWA domain-containing protein n=1 Tax=Conexibacter sp. CPCC 206217 TaxID=3064574 RepID=UPI002721BFD7|nr:VWA domain-containing protein [Conexibacter sp. CPCC 206217]MDO8210596.1 VWA domain-containing protein [Conexibacter sp. CPCC 206217]
MTLLSAWALAGFALLVPLVALHLRGRRLPRRETASLIGWRALDAVPPQRRRRLRPPPLPLLLALQALALVVLVTGLARPVRSAAEGPATHVFVLDDSIWMQAIDGGSTRFDAARRLLSRRLAALSSDAPVRIVLATADPSVRFSGGAREARGSLDRMTPTDGPADLGAAVRLAAGLRVRPSDPIELLHAPENPVPVARSGAGATGRGAGLRVTSVGDPIADRGLSGVSTRCGLPDGGCELLARVVSSGASPVRARVEVSDAENLASATTVAVPAHGSAPVVFRVPAGARLTLTIAGSDALPADDVAYAVVPGAQTVHVTVVGSGAGAIPLVGALAATPGVEVRLRAPDTYRVADARASDLLVIDGALPAAAPASTTSGSTTSASAASGSAGSPASTEDEASPASLPPAAALLLVHPSRIPGGTIAGHLADARLAGEDAADPLLAGVDLTSLAIDPAAVARVRLPRWMTPAAWARGGPLIASGVDDGQRVALLTFDPAQSTLPQLAGFPLLISNLLAWSQGWLPAQAGAASPIAVEQPPGTLRTSLEQRDAAGQTSTRSLRRGDGEVALTPAAGLVNGMQRRASETSARTGSLAVEPVATAIAPGAAIDLADAAGAATAPPARSSLAWWLLVVGLALLLLESALALRSGSLRSEEPRA